MCLMPVGTVAISIRSEDSVITYRYADRGGWGEKRNAAKIGLHRTGQKGIVRYRSEKLQIQIQTRY